MSASSQALDQLRGIRIANLHLWAGLTPLSWNASGSTVNEEPESVGFLLRLMGAHDLVHRRQIDRILAAVQPSVR